MYRKHAVADFNSPVSKTTIAHARPRRDPLPRTRLRWRLFVGLLTAGIVASGTVAAAGSGDAASNSPAPSRVDKVGNATINWHLKRAQPSARTAALIRRYEDVTAAHVAGVQLPPAAAPAPAVHRSGRVSHELPAELFPTMFAHPDHGTYCSTSTAPSPFGEQPGD